MVLFKRDYLFFLIIQKGMGAKKRMGTNGMGTKKRMGGKWSIKYKKSINCNKPKGFSQKQHCKYGRKTYKK